MSKDHYIKHIKINKLETNLKPEDADEPCFFYNKNRNPEGMEKHCISLHCNGKKKYFCYIPPKSKTIDYQI